MNVTVQSLLKQWQSSCRALSGGLRITVLTCPCVSDLERCWNVVMTLHVCCVMLNWGAEWQDHLVLLFFLQPPFPRFSYMSEMERQKPDVE